MIKQLLVFIICTVIGNLSFAQQASTGNTYALIIGVSKYLDPGIPQLQYANRDAIIFAEFLRSKAGGSVPAANIRLLIDSAANTGAVYDAVYWLKTSCKKDDKVFIYFSGHGDLENITMYNNGFLICYDSPPFNYVRLALSIDYLNDIANTLSLEKQAQVIIITDACHSGKLTAKTFKGNFLAADQLRKVKDKEIRITSSSADQLSNEKPEWGGGRGVFSYYLVNGLKGLAVKGNADKVTLNDLKSYLDSALKHDMVLKQDSIIQTPSLNGNGSFVLAKIDTEALQEAQKEIRQDTTVQRRMLLKTAVPEDEDPAEYFYSLIRQIGLENLTDRLNLDHVHENKIPFVLIDSLLKESTSIEHSNKLTELQQSLSGNKTSLELFNNRLATIFDEAGQRVITQYLRGDAAELERRRYYNANYNGYDVYPRMFQVALKLISPGNLYYYNNLKVKLHYFTGVAARLKIPLTEPARQNDLIEFALTEQKKALALENYAAYIYNELGVLYSYKHNDAEAAKYFKTAALRAPGWAIPRSNLADLYAEKGQFEKAILYADSAKMLQPGFQDIYMSYGLIYEKKGNMLQAEEAFQKSIKLNSRHFLPFERSGYVKLDNSEFAFADSMFYEAAERKKGFQFDDQNNPRHSKLPKTDLKHISCSIDPGFVIQADDLKGQLAVGLLAYREENLALAEASFLQVIMLDNKNPLAYHYLAKTLIEQKRWLEAELMLKLAMEFYLPYTLWTAYTDSVNKAGKKSAVDECVEICFRDAYYEKGEDHLLLASLYEEWRRFNESEEQYRKFIESDTTNSSGYFKLANMLVKAGRYHEGESVLTTYNIMHPGEGNLDLARFYRDRTTQFPGNMEWSLKAGLFNYDLARKGHWYWTKDKKSIDPLTGQSVYNIKSPRGIRMPVIEMPRLISYGAKIKPLNAFTSLAPFTNGIFYLKQAIDNMPYDEKQLADIHAKIGEMYVWQGLIDSAVYFFETALGIDTGNTGTRNSLIEAYGLAYRYKEAYAQLDSLAMKRELNRHNKYLFASYAIQDGDIARAEKLLLEAEAVVIFSPVVDTQLARLKAKFNTRSKNIKAALELYNSLYEMDKQDSIIIYIIARLHALSGNRTEAWKWLEKALKAGFNYGYVIRTDPALKPFRKDVRWKNMQDEFTWKKYPAANEFIGSGNVQGDTQTDQ